MIHYFNPGHEAAVLNASKYYQPPLSVRQMQRDLACLPAWYAAPEDFVFATINDLLPKKDELRGQTVDLWGLSPQAIHFFEQLNEEHGLDWNIPEWKDEYRQLSSRYTSAECLAFLIENMPEIEPAILPRFYSDISDIEQVIKTSGTKMLVKSPFSSSGRGLIWLPPTGTLARSERQIISGMLKKQKAVSIEKALEKVLDFSLHFEIKDAAVQFIGYSIFYTNTKGAYEKSLLAPQSFIEQQITQYIDLSLIIKTKLLLINFLKEKYSSLYNGCIGVDMLIYENNGNYFLQPCIEINMRKSMGYVAIKLFEKHIDNTSVGYFSIQHSKSFEQKTPVFENKRLKSGSLALCPITAETNYTAYLQVFEKTLPLRN